MSQLTPTQRWASVVLIAVFTSLLLAFGIPAMAYRVAIAIERGRHDAQAINVERQLDALSATSTAFRMVSEKVRPSVVHVNVFETTLRNNASVIDGADAAGPMIQRYLREAGSGVVIDAAGYVMTNQHVVHGASAIEVRLATGERFEAQLLGSDPRLDLALLKISPVSSEQLTAAKLGESSEQQVGDWVLAIGNPFGLDQSVTAGIISARGRRDLLENFDGEDLIQTDAAINPGNSGGPLVNLKGEIIGLNTFIIGGEGNLGIGFAIPSNTVKRAFEDFRDYGQIRRGWLGLLMHEVVPLDKVKAESELWMQVDYCIPDSPADKGGLKPGDVITRVDGKPFRSTRQMRQIIELKKPTDLLPLIVVRNGVQREVSVTVKMTPKQQRVLPGEHEWGISVAYNIAPELARQLGLPTTEGILVDIVNPPHAAGLLRSGDLIVEVNGIRTATIAAFAEVIRQLKPGERATLRVFSAGTERTVPLDMPEK